jgi:hypothetical protein
MPHEGNDASSYGKKKHGQAVADCGAQTTHHLMFGVVLLAQAEHNIRPSELKRRKSYVLSYPHEGVGNCSSPC